MWNHAICSGYVHVSDSNIRALGNGAREEEAMKTVLMGLAGLGMLVISAASVNASPLSTGTNLATPDTGASTFVEQVRHRSWHRRHHRWHRHHHHHHRRWR
jgi:hypothetical protein